MNKAILGPLHVEEKLAVMGIFAQRGPLKVFLNDQFDEFDADTPTLEVYEAV